MDRQRRILGSIEREVGKGGREKVVMMVVKTATLKENKSDVMSLQTLELSFQTHNMTSSYDTTLYCSKP